MKKFLSNLGLNKRLAVAAFALGLFALFGADPYNHTFTTINTKDLAYITEKNTNKIEPLELADWIIKQKPDFKLVDLRSEKQFIEYHIPGALNIKTTELDKSDLTKPERIILYSDNDMNAAESWFLLKAKDYKAVYILSGGMDGWKEKVLFPKATPNGSKDELAAFEKTKAVSQHFGSIPQTGVKEDSLKTIFTMPKLQAPVPNAKSMTPKKKKEGC